LGAGITKVVVASAAWRGCDNFRGWATYKWNAGGNERNRADLAERGFGIGGVERGTVFGDSAAGGEPHEGEACGFLFHSSSRFVSYTRAWRGHTLLWTNSQGIARAVDGGRAARPAR
jgi:hypothetical protein